MERDEHCCCIWCVVNLVPRWLYSMSECVSFGCESLLGALQRLDGVIHWVVSAASYPHHTGRTLTLTTSFWSVMLSPVPSLSFSHYTAPWSWKHQETNTLNLTSIYRRACRRLRELTWKLSAQYLISNANMNPLSVTITERFHFMYCICHVGFVLTSQLHMREGLVSISHAASHTTHVRIRRATFASPLLSLSHLAWRKEELIGGRVVIMCTVRSLVPYGRACSCAKCDLLAMYTSLHLSTSEPSCYHSGKVQINYVKNMSFLFLFGCIYINQISSDKSYKKRKFVYNVHF